MTDVVLATLPAHPAPASATAALAGRLARARWVAFVLGLLGLITLGLGLTAAAWVFGGENASWWQYPMLHGLPMVGTLLALFGSATFAAMSLAARVGGGPSICAADDDRPFPFLPRVTAGRLRRLGGGAALLSLALGVAAIASAGMVLVGGLSSVPGVEWMAWRSGYTWGIHAVTMTWSVPLLTALSMAGLCLGAALGRPGGARALPSRSGPVPALPAASGDDEPSTAVEVAETSHAPAAGVCPVCGCTVDDDPVSCERCGTAHHRDCFDYAGGCAIFGCDTRRWAARSTPATTESLAPLRTALEGWTRLYRGHWYALTAAVTGVTAVAWASALPIGGGSAGDLVDAAQAMGGLLALGGFGACVLGIVTYVILLALEAWRRRGLAALVDLPDRPPATESRQVVDRLDGSNPGESLAGLLTLLAFGSVVVSLLVPALREAFPSRWYTAFSFLERSFIPLLGVVFPLMLAGAARRRLAYMQSLQNRLAATLKKGADFQA